MKAYEIVGGWAHVCNCCEKDDGRPSLYWEKEDFDLCYQCVSSLYFKYIAELEKQDEKVMVKRRYISENLRNRIFQRDNWKCVNCKSNKNLEIDHKVPFSKGGITSFNNLQTLCKKCNLIKK